MENDPLPLYVTQTTEWLQIRWLALFLISSIVGLWIVQLMCFRRPTFQFNGSDSDRSASFFFDFVKISETSATFFTKKRVYFLLFSLQPISCRLRRHLKTAIQTVIHNY
eukprot:Gregarina_sp_Poly_1__6647@NODE_3578_length_995_cov_54_228448_g2273_i0_p2_GENE_NODE_3578_length_995_cov_54_228448_g2273_i0NODE_3578_length_995_cov_54_228448_g2273_i0_p2_ORF_typecomplete_len109_score4_57_NODE_3578_length_995_cov_54_228448_g2273_i0291617